jgi:predicted permease
VGFYLVGSVSQFTLGPLFQGRQSPWRTLVTTPIIYAAGLGIVLLTTGTPLPLWLANTVELLAGLAIPLMLLALGHSLGRFRVHQASIAVGVAALRLGIGFSLGLAAVSILDLHGVTRGVVLIQSSMPVAVFCFLLAARYDRDPEDVAAGILVSTLAAFVMLPLLLLFALDG